MKQTSNSILDSLKKIFTKMTGKKVVKRKTETDILSDIAESYDGVSKNYVNSLMSGALKRTIVERLPEEDIDTNTIYMVSSANLAATFGSSGNYKTKLADVLAYSELVIGRDYEDNGADNTQFKNNVVIKAHVYQNGKVQLEGYPSYSSYTFTVNGEESETLTGTNTSEVATYEQDILITAKSSTNYYKSINIYPSTSAPNNVYLEFMYIDNDWEIIGTTAGGGDSSPTIIDIKASDLDQFRMIYTYNSNVNTAVTDYNELKAGVTCNAEISGRIKANVIGANNVYFSFYVIAENTNGDGSEGYYDTSDGMHYVPRENGLLTLFGICPDDSYICDYITVNDDVDEVETGLYTHKVSFIFNNDFFTQTDSLLTFIKF